MERVGLDDPTEHLFIVDIEFDHKNASAKQIMYNEIFPPVVEKKKVFEPNERSIFQLMELYSETLNDNPKSYKLSANPKPHFCPNDTFPST